MVPRYTVGIGHVLELCMYLYRWMDYLSNLCTVMRTVPVTSCGSSYSRAENITAL